MSAVVCGKRLLFDDLHGSPPIIKRRRFSGGNSPPHFSSRSGLFGPSDSGSPRSPCSPSLEDQLLHLRTLFPQMDPQVVEKVLETCDNNLDSAIKSLHELCLNVREDSFTSDQVPASSHIASKDAHHSQVAAVLHVAVNSSPVENGITETPVACTPMDGSEWVEMLVREMMHATDLDDARARASRALEAFEKTVMARSGAAMDSFQKEIVALKGQLQGLLHDNQILKKAVAIQHERQLEHDERGRELQQLKQLLAQYQEEVRTLELKNYALTLHLRKAQEGSSMPGRFHPDVF
eukprot:c25158_g1_i1 orf=748-1626(-)